MTQRSPIGSRRLGRRDLLRAGGGMAAAAGLASVGFGQTSVHAQDSIDLTISGNHPEWQDPFAILIGAFQEANPGITVEPVFTPSNEYNARLTAAIAGGETADVLGIFAGDVVTRVRAGGELPFIDVTGKVDISGLKETAQGQTLVDGVVYGTPLASYTVGLAINNPVFALADMAPPRTWDELIAACDALKAAGVAAPLVVGGQSWIHPYYMYIGLASTVLRPEGFQAVREGSRTVTEPEVVAAAQLLVDLIPYYNEGFEATDYTTGKAIFAQGIGAMMVAGTTDYAGYYAENPDADLSFIAWPGPVADSTITSTGFELLYTVSSFSPPEKQEAAATFVNWLATKDAQQIVMDNISLSVHAEVTESTDPIKVQTVAEAAMGDHPVWYAVPETVGSLKVVEDNYGGLFSGRISPQEFAETMQASFTPSGA